jgi:two-component system, NarL family, response regulator LiaR
MGPMSLSPGPAGQEAEKNMMVPKTIKVMIVDDHPIVRGGLKKMLPVFDDLELTGEAENGQAALDCLRQNMPDVILMDILMPVMNGILATRAILAQYPQVKIIILTSFPTDELIQEALEAGAIGYLLKNAPIDTIADAIRSAYAGQSTLSPEATNAMFRMKRIQPKPGHDLSKRELEVLALIVEGLSNEEIAERLVISQSTARQHVSACILKLGAANRAQAAALAVKNSLVL